MFGFMFKKLILFVFLMLALLPGVGICALSGSLNGPVAGQTFKILNYSSYPILISMVSHNCIGNSAPNFINYTIAPDGGALNGKFWTSCGTGASASFALNILQSTHILYPIGKLNIQISSRYRYSYQIPSLPSFQSQRVGKDNALNNLPQFKFVGASNNNAIIRIYNHSNLPWPSGSYISKCDINSISYGPSTISGYYKLSALCKDNSGHYDNTSVTLPKGDFHTYINDFNGNLVVAGWSPAPCNFLQQCSGGQFGPGSMAGTYTLTEHCEGDNQGQTTSTTLPKNNFNTDINSFNGNLIVAGYGPKSGTTPYDDWTRTCTDSKFYPKSGEGSNPSGGAYTLTVDCQNHPTSISLPSRGDFNTDIWDDSVNGNDDLIAAGWIGITGNWLQHCTSSKFHITGPTLESGYFYLSAICDGHIVNTPAFHTAFGTHINYFKNGDLCVAGWDKRPGCR